MDAIKQLNDQKSKRFIKTHLPWKFLPLQLQNQTSKAKVSCIIIYIFIT